MHARRKARSKARSNKSRQKHRRCWGNNDVCPHGQHHTAGQKHKTEPLMKRFRGNASRPWHHVANLHDQLQDDRFPSCMLLMSFEYSRPAEIILKLYTSHRSLREYLCHRYCKMSWSHLCFADCTPTMRKMSDHALCPDHVPVTAARTHQRWRTTRQFARYTEAHAEESASQSILKLVSASLNE